MMVIRVANAQRVAPVNIRQITRLARCAIRALRIRTAGQLAITCIDARRMRVLNRRFKRHDRSTDVLSFRYDGERVIGEILIVPSEARRFARRARIPYTQELSRYVVHGLLHWLGDEDATRAQQARMRAREDQLLAQCCHPSPVTRRPRATSHGPRVTGHGR